MYRKRDFESEFEDFYLPFGGRLRSDNRWVRLSKLVPRDEIEQRYAKHFSGNGMGAPAKPVRVALGALIIKEKMRLTDEETVEQIRENPYLQYFLGYEGYQDEALFDPSMMVHFRRRLDLKELTEINELIHAKEQRRKPKRGGDDSGGRGTPKDPPNQGKLILDASCAPADIRYPTDLNLIGEAREKSEAIIDVLHAPLRGERKKVRTYRNKARKEYLNAAKRKRIGSKELQKALGKQLRYVDRNLSHIKELAAKSSLGLLSKKFYRDLLVIAEVQRQQKFMHENGVHRVQGRIVSISQPHVRPIVRGKRSAPVEFGAKISVSLVDGYAFVDRMSWDAYNESEDLTGQIKQYRRRFGCYPQSVHVDKIYRTRQNLRFCNEHGIRVSGPRLGRPPKVIDRKQLEQRKADEIVRIEIEGKLGEGKRRYSLGRIMAKLPETSGSVIGMVFLVMNMEKLLRGALLRLFDWLIETGSTSSRNDLGILAL